MNGLGRDGKAGVRARGRGGLQAAHLEGVEFREGGSLSLRRQRLGGRALGRRLPAGCRERSGVALSC
jgi:hypothetical protein